MSILLKSLLATFSKQGKTKAVSAPKPKAEVKEKKDVKQAVNPQLAKEAQSTATEIINFAREEASKIRETAQTEMRALQATLRTQEDKLHRDEEALIAHQNEQVRRDEQMAERLA